MAMSTSYNAEKLHNGEEVRINMPLLTHVSHVDIRYDEKSDSLKIKLVR